MAFLEERHFYVDDGCHSEVDDSSDDVVGSFKPKSFKAGVRCCANDGNTCITNVECGKGYMTYENAYSHCFAIGHRLCTKDELLSDICCGTGGDCDSHEVWTSTSSEPGI